MTNHSKAGRTEKLMIRLEKSEKTAIRAAAKAERVSMSEWVRAIVALASEAAKEKR